jgi:hypothetical protein
VPKNRKHTYEQATELVAPPESAADPNRMLAETMAEVRAGRMDPKVAIRSPTLELFCCGRMRPMRLQPRLSQPKPACH